MSSFESLGLQEDLVRVVIEKGWDIPRDVQDESIPHILNGNDVLIASETGSGKTGALGLPMVQLINEFTTTKGSFDLNTEHVIPVLDQYTRNNVGISITDSDISWEYSTKTIANNNNNNNTPISPTQTSPLQSLTQQSNIVGQIINAAWQRSGVWGGLRSNIGACKGKYYYEVKIIAGHTIRIGYGTKTSNLEIGQDVNSIGWGSTGFLVFGGKFLPIPGQNVIQCISKQNTNTLNTSQPNVDNDTNNNTAKNEHIHSTNNNNNDNNILYNGLNPNPITTFNPNQDPQTPEQREMVCYHPGDIVGVAADFDRNQLIFYRMRPTNLDNTTPSTSSSTQNNTIEYMTTRIAIVQDPFYQDIMYFPSICTKDANVDINFNGPFTNPVFNNIHNTTHAISNDNNMHDNCLTTIVQNNPQTLITTDGYTPFSHCVEHYIPITLADDIGDSKYTSYYNTKMEKNLQNPAYVDFIQNTAKKTSDVKGIIIAPTSGLCEQLYDEMVSFCKYIEPKINIALVNNVNDVKYLHQTDIIIATINTLETIFGTNLVDRPQFNTDNGSVVKHDVNQKQFNRASQDIVQIEFDGIMNIPLTISSMESLSSIALKSINDFKSSSQNNNNDNANVQHTDMNDENQHPNQNDTNTSDLSPNQLSHTRQFSNFISTQTNTNIHSEHGPLLYNCIFMTIDEADTFGEKLQSQVLYRLISRMKRDKDRMMTRYFLSQFNTHNNNICNDTATSTNQDESLLVQNDSNTNQTMLEKVPRMQMVMCSATIDPEKMKLLLPLLRKNYSTVHLRDRYELPKGLLQGVIYVNGLKFIENLKKTKKLSVKDEQVNQTSHNGDDNNSIDNDQYSQNWQSEMVPEKYLDYVHENAIELPLDSPFNRLVVESYPHDKIINNSNESTQNDKGTNKETETTHQITPTNHTTDPVASFDDTSAVADSDTVLARQIIASQASKMYKLNILGDLLSFLTTHESAYNTTLSLQTITQTINPQDLSHLNISNTNNNGEQLMSDGLNIDENGEVTQSLVTTDTTPSALQSHHTEMINDNDSKIQPNEQTDLLSMLTTTTNTSVSTVQQEQQQTQKAIVPTKLDKFLIFCSSNNDCIRIAMYLSALLEQKKITFGNDTSNTIESTTSESTPNNDDVEQQPTHQNKKQRNNNNNTNNKKQNNNNKKGGQLTYDVSLALSSYQSSSLLQLQYHPKIGCLINRGQSKQQLQTVLQKFQDGDISILICTDIGARGIDFTDVPVMINYNVPKHAEVYVQRCGRVARGNSQKLGLALSLVTTTPEYIWYHSQINHNTDDCEGGKKGINTNAKKYNNDNDTALEDSTHPCVKIQHSKIYFDDIQEKLNLHIPNLTPWNFSGYGDNSNNNNNGDNDVMTENINPNATSANTHTKQQQQQQTLYNPTNRQQCIKILPGYDSIMSNLFLRLSQEDVCISLHKQHAHIILQQNHLLSSIQYKTQREYFNTVLQYPRWAKMLLEEEKSISLNDQPTMHDGDELNDGITIINDTLLNDYNDMDLSDIDIDAWTQF